MRKMISIFVALNLLGVGINFVLQAGFGCDAITMINDGIARFLDTNYTLSGIVYNSILLVLALLFSRKHLGWGTLCYAYGTGVFIDMYQAILTPFQIAEMSAMFKVVVLLIGQLLLCFAFALLIERELGRSALDAVLAKVEEHVAMSYRVLKTICDICFVIIAYLLGATFGIGTIVCVLTGGYTIDLFCKMLRRKKTA